MTKNIAFGLFFFNSFTFCQPGKSDACVLRLFAYSHHVTVSTLCVPATAIQMQQLLEDTFIEMESSEWQPSQWVSTWIPCPFM